jgi:hypothetical protein
VTAATLLFFEPGREDERETVIVRQTTTAKRREEHLVCVACGHRITSEAERIAVAGAHAHTFTNPHGLSFHIGCFRAAAGCRDEGPGSYDYTWFAGYAWSVAVCAQCGSHLGWRYRNSGGDGFFGLILQRLELRGRDNRSAGN